jgi:hypothetical protein
MFDTHIIAYSHFHLIFTDNVSASKSSARIDTSALFWEEYEAPYTITGFYASDTFNIANTTVLNVNFAVVNSTFKNYPNPGGILGIGLDGFQTIAAQTGEPLPEPLDQLKAEGIISSLSYGIFLGGQCELVQLMSRGKWLMCGNRLLGSSTGRNHFRRVQLIKVLWFFTSSPIGTLTRPIPQTPDLAIFCNRNSE